MRVLTWAMDAWKTPAGKIISVIISLALVFSMSNVIAYAADADDEASEQGKYYTQDTQVISVGKTNDYSTKSYRDRKHCADYDPDTNTGCKEYIRYSTASDFSIDLDSINKIFDGDLVFSNFALRTIDGFSKLSGKIRGNKPGQYKVELPYKMTYVYPEESSINCPSCGTKNSRSAATYVKEYKASFMVVVNADYTLKYNSNGGNEIASTSYTIADTEATLEVTDSIPTREGKQFMGWAESKGAKVADYKAGDRIELNWPNVEKTLYAVWADPYTITYDWGTENIPSGVTLPKDDNEYSNNDSYTIDSEYTNDTKIEVTDDYGNVIERYTFSGWDTKDGIINNDLTVKGSWTKETPEVKTWSITYKWFNDIFPEDAVLPIDNKVYINNQDYKVDTTYKYGVTVDIHDEYGNVNGTYTFQGWKTEDGNITEDLVIDGEWKFEPKNVAKWHITYDWGTENVPEGVTLPTDETEYINNQPYSVDVTYKSGDTVDTYDEYGNVNGTYTFQGWDTEDGNITEDLTITGMWTYAQVNVETRTLSINYYKMENGNKTTQAVKDSVEHQNLVLGSTWTEAAIEIDGYDLYKEGLSRVVCDNGTMGLGSRIKIAKDDPNEINFYYIPKTDLVGTVHYYEMVDGVETTNELAKSKTVNDLVMDSTWAEAAIEIDGYNLEMTDGVFDGVIIDGNRVKGSAVTVKAENNEINFYYTAKTDRTLTVNYYKMVDGDKTKDKVADSKLVENLTTGSIYSEPAIDIEGYELVKEGLENISDNDDVVYGLTTTIKANNNEINFYYTAKKYTVTYQYNKAPKDAELPEALTEIPYGSTVKTAIPKLDGFKFSGWTDIKENGVNIKDDEFMMPADNVVLEGSWTRDTTGFKAEGVEVVYDGKTHAPQVIFADNNKKREDETVAYFDTATENWVEGLDAVSYKNVKKDSDEGYPVKLGVISTDDSKEVRWQAEEVVYVKIKPRPVTLTSASAEKIYDGTPLTKNTVTEDGWVKGEGASYDVTGSQTLVGESKNKFEYTLKDNTYSDNYTIDTDFGKLEVKDRPENDKLQITLTGNSSVDNTYDGTEHSVSGIEKNIFTINKVPFTVSGYETTNPKSINATSSTGILNKVSGNFVVRDEAGNDVTNQFDIAKVDGKLVVKKREVTITVDGKKMPYSQPEPYTATVTGLVNDSDLGDIIYKLVDDMKETELDVGNYPNAITAVYEVNDNYAVNVINGDLEVYASDKNGVNVVNTAETYDGNGYSIYAESIADDAQIEYSTNGEEWTDENPVFTDAGVYTVYARAKATKNYEQTDMVEGTVTIAPRAATIRVDDATKVVGTADPTFTGTVENLVNDEDLGTITYKRNNKAQRIGVYNGVLTADYDKNANYEVTIINGDFTIVAAPNPPQADNPVNPPAGDNPAAAPVPAAAPAAPAAAPAAAAPAAVIPDAENPLAAPADDGATDETTIADDENPMGAFDAEPECWVHTLMIIGMILTLIYGGIVIARRLNSAKEIESMDKTKGSVRRREYTQKREQYMGA